MKKCDVWKIVFSDIRWNMYKNRLSTFEPIFSNNYTKFYGLDQLHDVIWLQMDEEFDEFEKNHF